MSVHVEEYTALDFEHVTLEADTIEHGHACTACYAINYTDSGIYTCPECGSVQHKPLEWC